MGTVIFSIIGIALLVLTGMTMSQNFLSFLDRTTGAFADLSYTNQRILQTDISTLWASLAPDRKILEVAIRNSGQTALASFEQWDVIVQYYDGNGDYHVYWLPYVEGEPVQNQWTVKGIYLSAESLTSELLDQGILNPGEEMVLKTELSPTVGINTVGRVVISSPSSITASIHFQPPF